MVIECPECLEEFDLDECENDKVWVEDEMGVENHIMTYKCPHCESWIDEIDIPKR